MKITVTTTYNIIYKVEAFWSEEGGMGYDQHGAATYDLPDALRVLESARNTEPKTNWIITLYVTTTSK